MKACISCQCPSSSIAAMAFKQLKMMKRPGISIEQMAKVFEWLERGITTRAIAVSYIYVRQRDLEDWMALVKEKGFAAWD